MSCCSTCAICACWSAGIAAPPPTVCAPADAPATAPEASVALGAPGVAGVVGAAPGTVPFAPATAPPPDVGGIASGVFIGGAVGAGAPPPPCKTGGGALAQLKSAPMAIPPHSLFSRAGTRRSCITSGHVAHLS